MNKVYLIEARAEFIEENGYRTVINESIAIFSTVEKARAFVTEKENDMFEIDEEYFYKKLVILEVDIDPEEWALSMQWIKNG